VMSAQNCFLVGHVASVMNSSTGRCQAVARVCTIYHTMKDKTPITDLLRKTIQECGIPFLTLEQKTGVLRQSLMRFVRGETSLHLESADKLATYFGLELRTVVKTAKAAKVAKASKGKTDSQQGNQ